MLAGISSEYYVRLERGDATGISEGVVDGIVHALRLDDSERSHLLDLLRAANSTRASRRSPPVQQVRASVQRLMDCMVGTPAFVLNGRLDILASNELGRALYAPIYEEIADPPNNARFIFLNAAAKQFWPHWDKAANDTVAMLRTEAGRDPYDRSLTALIGELSTRSDEFRGRWADHNVRLHATGRKMIHHPTVGTLDLPFEFLPIPDTSGQSLLTYTAEPGSQTKQSLDLLASWATTPRDSRTASPTTDDR